jgi:hypothetical protein
MKLFGSKPTFCTICKKKITHKHKPKKEWKIEGPLCADCHLDKMKQFYEGTINQNCAMCGIKKKLTDMWEPRWQWEMEGLLCKDCFDKKEKNFNLKKEFCSLCGTKMDFFRYNPKSEWKVEGQICRKCWDSQKEKHG